MWKSAPARSVAVYDKSATSLAFFRSRDTTNVHGTRHVFAAVSYGCVECLELSRWPTPTRSQGHLFLEQLSSIIRDASSFAVASDTRNIIVFVNVHCLAFDICIRPSYSLLAKKVYTFIPLQFTEVQKLLKSVYIVKHKTPKCVCHSHLLQN